jgi:hypothetical protein
MSGTGAERTLERPCECVGEWQEMAELSQPGICRYPRAIKGVEQRHASVFLRARRSKPIFVVANSVAYPR